MGGGDLAALAAGATARIAAAGSSTAISLQRMADLIAFYHPRLWINHDIDRCRQLCHGPQFYR